MSNFRASEAGRMDKSEFSLTKAVEDLSQHGYAQTKALEEKQKTLISLQATLADVEKEGERAETALRSKVREFLMLEGEMERLEQHTKVLRDRCASISRGNTDLQIDLREEEENACTALATFNSYRDKMEGHRAVVLHVASQTWGHKELEEKRALVQMLTQQREELKEDLQNPNGNTVQMAKRENVSLKGEISAMKETIAKKREQLQKEFAIHTQIKRDIEIHSRRYDAIVKRLHHQLSRAQAVHRQMSEDVSRMERERAELKGQLD